ncbi:MAG: T9SS type A sorting domain-containing protein [Bacteroidales bacterium]|nr:T9SS type A sorting domain-containing protein [Bacteroidales bacterium]
MKKITILLFVIIPLINYAHSGDTINVQPGTIPIIDGTISTGEWSDAAVVAFIADGTTITCYLKHNGTDTLYIAQDAPTLNNGDQAFLWFDTEHNGGTTPQPDDYRISGYYIDFPGYDGEVQGTGSSWGSWTSPSGWISASTGMGWSTDHGQIEFVIAFNKIGITPGISSIIGFMIGFGDNPASADYWVWPSGGQDNNPNTWADLIFFNTQSNNNYQEKDKNISIFPNPNNGIITIETKNIQAIEIIDITGKLVKQIRETSNKIQIDLSSLHKGIYFIKIKTEKGIVTEKIILE